MFSFKFIKPKIKSVFNRKKIGDLGEQTGKEHLIKNKYKIIEQNFRTRYGEIDLIAIDKNDLVFVEVKTRRSLKYGQPYEAVDRRKQDHIVKSALQYIKLKKISNKNIRFDVISICSTTGEIELIKSAFMASGKYIY